MSEARGGNPWLPAGNTAASQAQAQAPLAPSGRKNGAGVAALVVGVVALVLAILVIFAPLAALLGLIAALLGIVGTVRAGKGVADNRGQAIAGLVTGGLALLLGAAITISFGTFLATHANDLRTLTRCIDDAPDPAAKQACAQQFSDKVK
jgi:uncharacterized membrane protein HdeD (DUF308 family)